MQSSLSSRSWWVAVPLLGIVALSVLIEWPGLGWMNGLGAFPGQSLNVDDNRFVGAAQDFARARLYLAGYPYFMTAQLFAAAEASRFISGAEPSYPTLLRAISLVYAQLAVAGMYLLARFLGASRLEGLLAALFLATAPTFVTLANQGTPDVAVLVLFFATMIAGAKARRTGSRWWFYACCALAGASLAAKFFLPALIPPALLILAGSSGRRLEDAFVAVCVSLSSFYAASFFCYTLLDFARLVRMLAFDNLVVSGGYGPLQQIVGYGGDLVAGSGILVFVLSLVGAAVAARGRRPAVASVRDREAMLAGLSAPAAMFILPLLANFLLLVVAQVHAPRHVLPFIPFICLAAAFAVSRAAISLRRRGAPGRGVAGALVLGLCAFAGWNGWMTGLQYADDPRVDLVAEIERDRVETGSLHFYSHLRRVRRVAAIPSSPRFVTCDIEFDRFLAERDARRVFHAHGGQQRLEFYHALFAGRTAYGPPRDFLRPARSVEERLASAGLLPWVHSFVPRRCALFERRDLIAAPRTTENDALGASHRL